jgi:hypothetical protein
MAQHFPLAASEEATQPTATTPSQETSEPTIITPPTEASLLLRSLPEFVQKLELHKIFTDLKIIKVGDAQSLSLRGPQTTLDEPRILCKGRGLDHAVRVSNRTKCRKRFTLLGHLQDLMKDARQNENRDGNIDVELGDDGYGSAVGFIGDENDVDSARGSNSDHQRSRSQYDAHKFIKQWMIMSMKLVENAYNADVDAAANALIGASGDEDRQSVLSCITSSITCDVDDVASLKDSMIHNASILQDEVQEPNERWELFVKSIVRPWLDGDSPSMQRIFSRYGVGTEGFRNQISTRVRETVLGEQIIKTLFGDSGFGTLPFAKSFKLLWNEAHSKKKPSLTDASNAEAKKMVIDVVHDIMKQVFCKAVESHAQSKEPIRTAKSGISVAAGSIPGSKRSQKMFLASIPEQSASELSSAENAKKELGKWAVKKQNPGLVERLASTSGTFTKPLQPSKSASEHLKSFV